MTSGTVTGQGPPMTPRESLWDALGARKPLTVGAIADSEALRADSPECDLVELRLDSLGTGDEVLDFAKRCPLPLLITARGPSEGGQNGWTEAERGEAYGKFMPYASAIDLELRDFEALDAVISEAKAAGVVVVGSFHDFEGTPPEETLAAKLDERADVHKFALMALSARSIHVQLELLTSLGGRPLSVMGMGPLGAAARPLMAKAGSLLNYGYLGRVPTAPDQWPAGLLKKALSV